MAQQYGYGREQNPYNQRDNSPGGYGQPQSRYGRNQGGYGAPQDPYGAPQDPYGAPNPYGGQQNPYGGQQNPYAGAQNNSYGQPPAPPHGGSRYNNQNSSMDGGYAGSNVEMASLTQNAGSMASGTGQSSIMDECRDIGNETAKINEMLQQLQAQQQRTLSDADSSSNSDANRKLDALSSATMAKCRAVTERMRVVKSRPDANQKVNVRHVQNADKQVKSVMGRYNSLESEFAKANKQQIMRQYRIVRPDASDAELQAVAEDTNNGQVFSQALMQSDRQGRARAALSAVQDRHRALEKIEQQVAELAQLFQQVDQLVEQQDAAVTQIEQKGEEVVDNLDKGNEEMGVAVNTARKTRKKKWICLGICVAIVLIIVIVVLIYIFVIRGQNNGGGGNDNGKRAVEGVKVALARMNSRPLDVRSDPAVSPELARVFADRIHLPAIQHA
ncbi:hypothetical protein K4F52_003628 [Lecanicillium sp. MT-2017a]|nr:hypothetical protein K4F52_003628 [Lecanicillium sp. MT-2017a]